MSTKKIIKICSPQLGMSQNSVLGGEIYDYQTIKGFTQKGFEVFVFLPKNRPFDKNLKNLKVVYAPITHIVPPWVFSFLMLPYLFKAYKKEKFDILRVHTPRFLGIGAMIFHLFFRNIPILVSSVTVDDSWLFYPIEKKVFKIATAVIVQSEYMKGRVARRFNISKEKIFVTYGGILDNPQKPIKLKVPDLKMDDPVVLFMGVMIKRKNPAFLIDVLEEVKEKVPNIKMIFIGDGPERERLIRIAKEKSLEKNTIFIKKAFGGEKSFWFNRMDIFVLPSFDEGFGLAATEAMTFSKPVVTSDRAAFLEIIDSGKNGYTLNLDKKDEWVSTIIKLIENKKLAKKIGKKGKEKVNKYFNWEKTANLNAEVIRRMIG